MLRLLPFFLLVIMAVPATADSVWRDGDATGDLVGAFDASLDGTFVSASQTAQGIVVHIPGAELEIEMALESPILDGPLADFGPLQLHDNVYGWIHIQGDARLRAEAVQEFPRGLRGDGWYLTATDLVWQHVDGWLHIQASDTLISNDGGFQNFGPEPSAWALLQAGTGRVMDWFAFGEAPFATSAVGDVIDMAFVGTIGDDAPDTLVRLEEDGHFADRADRFVFRFGSVAAANVPAADLLLQRGPLSFNATRDGHNIVNLRLPSGVSGHVQWQQDLQAPSIAATTLHNIDPYAPLVAPPTLVATWSEPVWASLHIGEYAKVATHAAEEVRFRLVGLEASTTYVYTLHARDLAGNGIVETGEFTTGPASGPAAHINVTAVDSDADGTRIQFQALAADGGPVPMGLVHLFIDKRADDSRLSYRDGQFWVDVPPGASEVRIEVVTPEGRVSKVVDLSVPGQGAPLAWWLPLAALAFARRR